MSTKKTKASERAEKRGRACCASRSAASAAAT